jgi:hypothetical protein
LIAHKVHGYGLAIMTNADQGGAVMQEIRRRVERAYEWDSVARPAPRGYDAPPDYEEIELPAEMLRSYVGSYQVEGQGVIRITLTGGQLTLQPPGGAMLPLLAAEPDHLFLRVAPVELLFERNADGEVSGFTLVQGQQRSNVPKLP